MSDTPAVVSSEHDAEGRLVAVRFESSPPPPASDNRWLVAIDGSPYSLRAVSQAQALAAASREFSIELVYVHPLQSLEAARDLPQHGWEISRDARELLDAARAPWRLHVVMGAPAATLAELGQTLGVKGIVIGSHGRSGFRAMVMGSVTLELLHLAKVSVLVVR